MATESNKRQASSNKLDKLQAIGYNRRQKEKEKHAYRNNDKSR